MADNEGVMSKAKIPKMDDTNSLHWLMQMKAHLRHKGLIKYISEAPVALEVPQLMHETSFEAVVAPDNEESPYEIWNSIIRRYTLTSFKGVLKDSIADMHKMLTKIALVKLRVPVWSFHFILISSIVGGRKFHTS
ncbi:uncharacterized protein VP01_3558g1 [Puccinia sorghi]|uniref:Uncharacterized protein n=1 Tax=Puccinia sorghi TaxID=27349 RepID=A0A0L6UVD8_9BASI|nr:uncharacterized protein VP01_3558g1 [Puccinia sorghi]